MTLILDVTRSLSIAKKIEAVKKNCWRNAFLAFSIYEELHTGWYVEGWAIPDKEKLPLSIEHAWIEQADGTIIDPTWAMQGHTEVLYFPAQKYTYTEVAKRTRRKSSVKLPLISKQYANPLKDPAYFQAYRNALQFSRSLVA